MTFPPVSTTSSFTVSLVRAGLSYRAIQAGTAVCACIRGNAEMRYAQTIAGSDVGFIKAGGQADDATCVTKSANLQSRDCILVIGASRVRRLRAGHPRSDTNGVTPTPF